MNDGGFGESGRASGSDHDAMSLMQQFDAIGSRETKPVLAIVKRELALDDRWITYDNMVELLLRVRAFWQSCAVKGEVAMLDTDVGPVDSHY